MPAQTRIGDNDTGHDACPPRPLAAGSPNVFISSPKQGHQDGIRGCGAEGVGLDQPTAAAIAWVSDAGDAFQGALLSSAAQVFA